MVPHRMTLQRVQILQPASLGATSSAHISTHEPFQDCIAFIKNRQRPSDLDLARMQVQNATWPTLELGLCFSYPGHCNRSISLPSHEVASESATSNRNEQTGCRPPPPHHLHHKQRIPDMYVCVCVCASKWGTSKLRLFSFWFPFKPTPQWVPNITKTQPTSLTR